MKSRRTYGRYIAIGLVIVIALICVWALVFTREVSFADAAGFSNGDVLELELSTTAGPRMLESEQTRALFERLDTLELTQRTGSFNGGYAHMSVLLNDEDIIDLLLSPDELYITQDGRRRKYSFDDGTLESFVRSLASE